MTAKNPHPWVYEINTRVWLEELSRATGRKLTLGQVPDDQWRRLAELGMDYVWLMGVWLPSPASRQEARAHSGVLEECAAALSDYAEHDVGSSPYAVAGYRLNPALGGAGELPEARQAMARAGLGLILDWVPNHTARDHPWVSEHPEYFVSAEGEEAFPPGEAFAVLPQHGGRQWVAMGRDPYFPPWTDTAQVCTVCPPARAAFGQEMARVARLCDGLRCDMAMLALGEVFFNIWGKWLKEQGIAAGPGEYWEEVLSPAKTVAPELFLMGESYWGKGQALLDLGLDYVYDKPGYDALLAGDAAAYASRLHQQGKAAARRVRFLENHDEPRLAAALPDQARRRAAAVLQAASPGMRLWHHGQLEGHRIKVPVQLLRGPEEETDSDWQGFMEHLLGLAREPLFKEGRGQVLGLRPPTQWDATPRGLVGLAWERGGERAVVAVNLGESQAAGWLGFAPGFWEGWGEVLLHDHLGQGETYRRDAGDLGREGLFVRLPPGGCHWLRAG